MTHERPMDFFTDVFRWHRKFLPPLAQPEGLLLMSETELLALDAPGVRAVAPLLRDGVSLAAHCREVGPPALLAEMLHALESLVRQGLARPVRGERAEQYVLPDFSSLFARVRLREDADVVVLSNAVSEDAALRWAQEALANSALTVVFCDDCLDPRLGHIDAQQRAAGQPWLLVKPGGEQAMVGPLFTSQKAASPCWHCLAHRLHRNQPARAWWQARHGNEVVSRPVLAGSELIERRLKNLLPMAQCIVAQRGPDLWTPDPEQPHAVVARPQCPHCGDAGLMARLQRQPVKLASCLSGAQPDGGWRTMPASATVERLAPHVDPLSGVIARVVPLGVEAEDALTVYRSEIFRTPASERPPSANALVQVCLGKGMSSAQSRASAMCEAIERYAAFHQGDEAHVIAAPSGLDARCIPAHALARFSQRQYDQGRLPSHAVAPKANPSGDAAWWAPAWSLAFDVRCYLPLSFCYANAPVESQRHVLWTSNGCAAGNTREEAILQGFLELVERDAAAIWWYGRIQRPGIELGLLPAASRARLARSLDASWRCWALDITHDFGIPVVAAIGRHRATGDWAIGFGCSASLVLACERALTEMSQLIAAQKKFAVPHADDPENAPAFLVPAQAVDAMPRQVVEPARADIAEEIKRCVRIASALGMDTVVLDHTRPDIPLCTVKVVVPGLCHIWPELGNPRLYQVPVAMGWRATPMQEHDLNPHPLYV